MNREIDVAIIPKGVGKAVKRTECKGKKSNDINTDVASMFVFFKTKFN